jgi:hypothetical protein
MSGISILPGLDDGNVLAQNTLGLYADKIFPASLT